MSTESFTISKKALITLVAASVVVIISLGIRQTFGLFYFDFNTDLDISISECKVLYDLWDDYPGEVQEILVNMMFNLGRPRLSGFKNFKKAVDAGDWAKAGIEGRDSKWHKQVGNRAERLMVRMENV